MDANARRQGSRYVVSDEEKRRFERDGYVHLEGVLSEEELAPIEGLATTKPEGGYFFLGNVSRLGIESPELCHRLLEATGVALTPMVAWGADDFGRHHVRFIFTDEPEARLREAGALVADFVRGLER